jgi:hypothetical protein
MNTLLVNLVFGILSAIFLSCLVIIIRNAAKIRSFNNAVNSTLSKATPAKIVHHVLKQKSEMISLSIKPLLQLPPSLPRLKLPFMNEYGKKLIN